MNSKLNINESTIATLHAKVRRNPSDISAMLSVSKGEVYHISLKQIVSKWKDWFIPSPLHGFHWDIMYWFVKPRIPKANYFCVCGGIGPDDSHLFVIFENESEVKNGKDIEIKKDGEFFLFANDAVKHYGNNKGEILLEIRRLR